MNNITKRDLFAAALLAGGADAPIRMIMDDADNLANESDRRDTEDAKAEFMRSKEQGLPDAPKVEGLAPSEPTPEPGWISVDDRLPEGNFPTFSDTVPARGDDSSNEWFPAYYVFTRDEWLDCDDSEISVTHWYDLPDLPEVTP